MVRHLCVIRDNLYSLAVDKWCMIIVLARIVMAGITSAVS